MTHNSILPILPPSKKEFLLNQIIEVNPYFEKVAKERGFYSQELMDKVARTGSVHEMENIAEDVKAIFSTAHNVTPEWYVRMQAAFQKYTDNTLSKTVNLPRDATVDDVHKFYKLAYDLGCKSVTIYRDGSKEDQVLSFDDKKKWGASPWSM